MYDWDLGAVAKRACALLDKYNVISDATLIAGHLMRSLGPKAGMPLLFFWLPLFLGRRRRRHCLLLFQV
jgi:hypothetical protein